MGGRRLLLALALVVGTVMVVVWLSMPTSPSAQNEPSLPPSEPDGGVTPVAGQSRYRYREHSPVWSVLERATRLPALDSGASLARDLRFVAAGREDRFSEATLAMAVSATQGRTVAGREVHGWACPDEATTCRLEDYLRSSEPSVRVTRAEATPGRDRATALAACRLAAGELTADLRRRLDAHQGVVIVGFVPDGFPDFVEDTSVHLFAVQAVDNSGALFLKDGADVDPVTYRLDPARLCDFMVAPSVVHLESAVAPVAPSWDFRPLFVEAREAAPAPAPVPMPTPVPMPEPAPVSEDGLTIAFDGPTPLDLGWFRIPVGAPLLCTATGSALPYPPASFQLRMGVSAGAAQSLGAWLEELERARSVIDEGDGFRHTSGGNPLWDAYRHQGGSELAEVRRLTRHFTTAGERFGKAWTLWAIVRFVQEIPYETIPEDPMGLRSPSRVLAQNGGDCDSKSLLAGVMLEAAGFQAAVIDLSSERHAMLGVEARDVPLTPAMTTVEADGRRYVVIESTYPWALGDVANNRAWADGRARSTVIPIEVQHP